MKSEIKSLSDVIMSSCGCSKERAEQIAKDAGYYGDNICVDDIAEVMEQDCIYVGTCWDGNNRASVWRVKDGYHVSCGTAEMFSEAIPEDFIPESEESWEYIPECDK